MLVTKTLQVLSEQARLFDRAMTFDGRPRERLVALGEAEELCYRLYPVHYRSLQVIRAASQVARASAPRPDALQRCESHLIGLLSDVMLEGVHAGDLHLAAPRRPEEVAFTLWALAFGARALMHTAVAASQLNIADGFRTARDAADMLLDALNWQPLASEWDYELTRTRIRREVFPDEWRRACAA